MTNYSKKVLVIAVGLAMVSTVINAQELWDPHLRGVNEGLAAGALPPEGVYGIINSYWASYKQYDNAGNNSSGVKLDALVEVPIILWSTGWKVLGADYAMGIAQPFDYTNLKLNNDAAFSNNGHWGTFNTILIPGQLSWSLANDVHVKAGLDIYLPDASSSPGHLPANVVEAGSGNNFWTVQPEFAVSWLHDGWNVTVDANYAYNFKNTTTDYKSGQELGIDYTVAKNLGQWTVGLGAHQIIQLSNDSGSGANTVHTNCANNNGCKVSTFGLGPLLGYNFGKVSVMAEYNHAMSAKNEVAGDIFNVRLAFPFQ